MAVKRHILLFCSVPYCSFRFSSRLSFSNDKILFCFPLLGTIHKVRRSPLYDSPPDRPYSRNTPPNDPYPVFVHVIVITNSRRRNTSKT